MSNKETAIAFMEMCALESPEQAFLKYVGPHFKHHNQYFKGDGPSLMRAMMEASKTHPNKSFTIKQIFENEDRVALYSHVAKETMDIAVLHILRFESGKIVEMWDVGQAIDKNSPNEHGMF